MTREARQEWMAGIQLFFLFVGYVLGLPLLVVSLSVLLVIYLHQRLGWPALLLPVAALLYATFIRPSLWDAHGARIQLEPHSPVYPIRDHRLTGRRQIFVSGKWQNVHGEGEQSVWQHLKRFDAVYLFWNLLMGATLVAVAFSYVWPLLLLACLYALMHYCGFTLLSICISIGVILAATFLWPTLYSYSHTYAVWEDRQDRITFKTNRFTSRTYERINDGEWTLHWAGRWAERKSDRTPQGPNDGSGLM